MIIRNDQIKRPLPNIKSLFDFVGMLWGLFCCIHLWPIHILHPGNAGRHESLVAGGGTPSTGLSISHEWHESTLHLPFAFSSFGCITTTHRTGFVSFCYGFTSFSAQISQWRAAAYLQGDVPCAPQLSLSASATSMDLKR